MTRLPVCALLGAIVAAMLMAGCGGDNQPSDAEQVRDVVTNFQRQVDATQRGRLIACSLLTPSEHQRRDELGGGPCERTLPTGLQSAHIESVDVLDHKATVILSDGRKIGLNKIPMPFSETVSNPAQVWRISELPPSNETTVGATNAKSVTLGDRGGQKLSLRRCSTGELAEPAGHDVQVSGTPCGQVGVPPVTGLMVASEHKPALFQEKSGWVCWQRLIENGATTDNVCWRGYEVVLFQFSG